MKKAIAWHIGQDTKPVRLEPGYVDLERNLEDWVYNDVEIVAEDVLLIGRQIDTAWGTTLDLLGIDEDGNLVVIELKRNQTLRETVAQTLEYSAWASRLGYQEIVEIAARKRFKSREDFLAAFRDRFDTDLPETLNSLQRMLIVAPNIDDPTSEVIDYLSRTFRMPVNAVSFDVFGNPGDQTLVRHFVLETVPQAPTPANAKTRQAQTLDEAIQLAADIGVREIVEPLLDLSELFPDAPGVNKTGWTFYPPIGNRLQGHAGFAVILRHYNVPQGAVGLGLKPDVLAAMLGGSTEDWEALLKRLPGGPKGSVRKSAVLFLLSSADDARQVVDKVKGLVRARPEAVPETAGADEIPQPVAPTEAGAP